MKEDRIVFDLNGGPYLKHRFLRHIDVDGIALVPNDGAQVTGGRVTLLFEGGLPGGERAGGEGAAGSDH